MRRNCARNNSAPKHPAPPPRGESRATGGQAIDRRAERASPDATTTASGPKNLTTRHNTFKPRHPPGATLGNAKPTAMDPHSSGAKSSDSGSQRPSTNSAATSGASFTCKCGKNYLSKATLARHQKDCGVRDTSACQFCGATFPTFPGVRQHERRQHPELYQKELEAKLPAPESELMAKLADIEARATNGIFYGAMTAETGLSKNQVRYRRERPEYRDFLDRAKRKLAASVSQARLSPPVPTTPRARRYAKRVRFRDSELDDPTPEAGLDAASQTACPRTTNYLTPNKNLVVLLERIPESTSSLPRAAELSVQSSGEGSRDEFLGVGPDYRSPFQSPHEMTNATPHPTHDFNVSLSSQMTSRRRLSSSLPSLLLPEPICDENGSEELNCLRGIRNELKTLLDDPPEAITNINEVMGAVKAALDEPCDHVLQHVDRWLTTFGKGKRKPVRRMGNRDRPAHYGQTNTGRGSRAATFKKMQDLFVKNRKALADAILEGRDVEESGLRPDMEQLTELFGGILEKVSPPDEQPFRPFDVWDEDQVLPISPEEIDAAKNGWRVSAAGADGISVQAVKNRSSIELSALFNVILCRNVQPTTWRQIRTTLVPKGGDLSQPTNWRPISVGSAVQRLLHRVLVTRLKSGVSLSMHQRGFVETDGTLANAMILHQYLYHRTGLGKGYNVVSLDIRKAFDTVSHHSIRRALRRFCVPEYLEKYIMSTFEATTTLNLGRGESRPIDIRSGVRQGDPLSPLLFNAVMDELLVSLNEKFSGGLLPNGAKCAAMAFADDLILMSDRELDIPLMLDEVETFLRHRGMEVNAAKCRALVAKTSAGRSVPRSRAIFSINNLPIPTVPSLNAFRYLGHEFGHSGIEKPGLFRLPEWLRNIMRAPLKPDQKLALIKTFVLPRLLYSLQNPKVTSRSLRDADRLIRKNVRAAMHLNSHTPDSLIHASVRDGGLGVMELRSAIPRILLGRLAGLLERSSDPVVLAVLQSDQSRALMAKLQLMAGDVPGPTVWRAKIASGVLSRGLEQTAEDSASRSWIDAKPTGWSGRDYVRAVQLRTANLPTKAIPSNPVGQRRCRGGCQCDENISHVLQTCPVTHWERIRRHDEIVTKIARHCKSKRWVVEEEPHVRHSGGQLFKPDLVVHQPGNVSVVADVQVSWDATDLGRAYERKRVVYDNAVFREAAAKRWPGKSLLFAPVILGARGIWPRVNNDRSAVLAIPPVVRRGCVLSALRWGSTIHSAFMKAVWRKSKNPRLLTTDPGGVG